jgi:hypothetical protein
MKSRRFAAILVLVVALTVSAVTVASAHAGKSKANFDASAAVQAVGPGPEFSTDIKVKMKGKGEERHIDRITIKTTDEGVIAGPTAVHVGCEESGVPGACAVTSSILNGTAVVSLHDSRATLRNVSEIPSPIPGLGALGFKAYSGSLDGKLKGSFSIVGGLPLDGSAKLNIVGSAIYACFAELSGPTPLPTVAGCDPKSDDHVPGSVFIPVILDVVDTGSFKIKPEPGTAVAGDRELTKLTGDLTVQISAFGQPAPIGLISIEDAKAKYVSLTHEHPEDEDDDDDEKKHGKKKDKHDD